MRNIWDIRRVYSVRSSLMKEVCWSELTVLQRMERSRLKWCVQVERLAEERLIKRPYRANVEGNRERLRQHRRGRDKVKERADLLQNGSGGIE